MKSFNKEELLVIKGVIKHQLTQIDDKINHYTKLIKKHPNNNYYESMLEEERKKINHFINIYNKI